MTDRRDLISANAHFENGIYHGSPFEAYYYLGEIHANQASLPNAAANSGSCAMAVSFHKMVAERGAWEEDLLKEANTAWESRTERGKEMAKLKWWIAAERGLEVAQNNLAFVLDQDKSLLRLGRFAPHTPSNDTARLALTQWTRSAAQRNVDSLVKVGDYYYHGLGLPPSISTSNTSLDDRYEIAARYYRSAADTQVSALAMWNLGWMYENGVGVPQDFHLAKRHYDQALDTNKEAYLPVMISLIKLHMKSAWHTMMGGEGGLSLFDNDETAPLQPWELDGTDADPTSDSTGTQDIPGSATDAAGNGGRRYTEDEHWYLGKAHDDFQRRKDRAQRRLSGLAHPDEDVDDPVQWARDHRLAEDREAGDFGPEDYFEGAMRVNAGAEEGETWELVVILFLVGVMSVLIWWRSMIQRRARQQERAARIQDLAQEVSAFRREVEDAIRVRTQEHQAREQEQQHAGPGQQGVPDENGNAGGEDAAPPPVPPPAEPFNVLEGPPGV